jgi:sugar phosphate isomerase/epimerase
MTSYLARLACHTIGWGTPTIGRDPLDQVLREIRGLGFAGVELAVHQLNPYRGREHEVGALLRSLRLTPVAVYQSVRLCCDQNLALEIAEANRTIELAACLGTSMVVFGSPPDH